METLDRRPDAVAELLSRADRLAASGGAREAVSLLSEEDRRSPHPLVEERLVQLRHEVMGPADQVRPAAGTDLWPAPVPDLFPGGEVPEVEAAEVTLEMVTTGLAHHGCILLRGLLSETTAEDLCQDAHRAASAAAAAADGAPVTATTPWYVPFEAHPSYSFGPMERAFSRHGDGVLTVESPRMLARVIDTLMGSRLGDLVEGVLGETPVLSAKKSTLRWADRTSLTGWHQDGAFLGKDIKTINSWVALSPCGRDAPSIDIVPRRFSEIVATGTDGAHWSWSVSDREVERLGTSSIRRPEFAPGDALLFDQMSLHRTGVSSEMTEERVAIESWFFAPSTYPEGQVPIFV